MTNQDKRSSAGLFSPPSDTSWVKKGWWNPRLAFYSALIGLFIAFKSVYIFSHTIKGYRLDVFIVVFLVATVAGYLTSWNIAKKSFFMRSWCRKHGWTFYRMRRVADAYLQHAADLQNSKLYSDNGRTEFSMCRKFGDRGVILTRHYKRRDRRSGSSTFLAMDYDGHCPDMIIHGHHKTDKIKLPGQMPTVKFEVEEFNRRWTVTAEDAKAAYDRMDQSTMEYLLSVDIPLTIEITGGLLIIQSQNDTLENRLMLMSFAEGLSKAVPDDLMQPIEMLPKDSED